MQIGSKNLVSAILFWLVATTQEIFAAPERSRVILVYPNNINPLKRLSHNPDVGLAFLMRTKEQTWAAGNLTKAEIRTLNTVISVSKGAISKNNIVFSVGNNPPLPPADPSAINNRYLTNTPLCNNTLNNVDFVVIDTVAYSKNLTQFENVNIIYDQVFSESKEPCHPHASEVISILVGKTTGVHPKGDRRIINEAVFNCNGQAFPEQIIKGFNAALQFARLNAQQGRRTIVNFSGVGPKNQAINLASMALVKENIPVFVAAGNGGIDACLSQSPASAAGVCAIGGTMFPGNIAADFTNFGNPCVQIYLPGDAIDVVDIDSNSVKQVSGTSASSPIGAALGATELQLDNSATPKQVIQRLVSPPRTRLVPSFSAVFDQPITVMLNANACAEKSRIFNSFTTAKSNNNKFVTWYSGLLPEKLCISFSAESNASPILIGLRCSATDNNPFTIQLGNSKAKQNYYANTLKQHGVLLNATNINKKTFSSAGPKIFHIQYSDGAVSVESETTTGASTLLLFSAVNTKPKEISFGGVNGKVTYTGAFNAPCKLRN